MFYVNNYNMDELFRDAAENYDLPTEQAFDWEMINNALSETENKQPGKKKKRRFVLWYLLFIPLGWFANYVWNYKAENNLTDKNILKQETGLPNISAEKLNNRVAVKKNDDNKKSIALPLHNINKSDDKLPFHIILKPGAKNTKYVNPVFFNTINGDKTVVFKNENTFTI